MNWNERYLVHVLLATSCWTPASNFHILKRKLVVVSQFLAARYRSECKDNDVLLSDAVVDDLRVAVGVTRMIDKPSRVAGDCSVDNFRLAQPEHVTTVVAGAIRSRTFVLLLAPICQHGAYHFAGVLDHHLAGSDVTACEQSQSVNRRAINGNSFFHRRPEMTETHRHWQVHWRHCGNMSSTDDIRNRNITVKWI